MALCWRYLNIFTWTFLIIVLMWNFKFVLACGVGKGSYAKKNYPPFSKYQQKPEEDEESAVASGRFSHKIKYGSPEFKEKIVRYFGTNVVFSDDEGTGADRYMTKRCEKALQRLAQHVRIKWHNKVKVRVIEAWDEDGEHYSRSLHYEGRAIDITTSDRDRSKYGALASLAYFKAEFDWVTYLDGHVHVSCKRDDAVDERNSCFPGHMTVITENGNQTTMSNLRIGDKVLTEDSSGKLRYSKVIMFMDSKPRVTLHSYVTIYTGIPGVTLELTRKHLLFISKDGIKFETVFAESVQSGDFIKVLNQSRTGLIQTKVTKVQIKSGVGAYAPLTEEGTLLVNGVLTSCYALTEDHNIAHWSFFPWRYTYDIFKPFLQRKPQTGLHWYVRVLRTINNIVGILPEV